MLQPKHDWISIFANVVMWAIAGCITLLGLFLGIAAVFSLFGTGDYVVGVIICAGLTLFGLFIAFAFISMFKFISNMLFYRSIFNDYKKRKERGDFDDKL